ncbi:hypothetical protein AZ78_4778 [Lysobacter capsici AZ78]|uniref:Uncharacterized protein n=1 Tax=Lysobacter capsici AZ78 TaxID=1444315 RepID=A0A108UDM0_9GAMM|nr:hypothetical protein AZ78_4778 [Lysobacter capsici AZ78]
MKIPILTIAGKRDESLATTLASAMRGLGTAVDADEATMRG